MRIFKSHPLLKLVNSFVIDVRYVKALTDHCISNQGCFHTPTSIELDIPESVMSNTASLSEGVIHWNLLKVKSLREVLSKTKTILSKDKSQLFSNKGNQFCSYGLFIAYDKTNLFLLRETSGANFTISISNEMSYQSKERYSRLAVNVGLPKGSDPYGNGVPVVPAAVPTPMISRNSLYGLSNVKRRGRGTVFETPPTRYYSTDVQNNVISKLESLTRYCKNKNHQPVDRNLFGILKDPHFLELAYNNIKSKPGNMTPGVTPETLDGIN